MSGSDPVAGRKDRGRCGKPRRDLTQVTEPSGLVTTFTYDALARRTSETEVSDTLPATEPTQYL